MNSCRTCSNIKVQMRSKSPKPVSHYVNLHLWFYTYSIYFSSIRLLNMLIITLDLHFPWPLEYAVWEEHILKQLLPRWLRFFHPFSPSFPSSRKPRCSETYSRLMMGGFLFLWDDKTKYLNKPRGLFESQKGDQNESERRFEEERLLIHGLKRRTRTELCGGEQTGAAASQ